MGPRQHVAEDRLRTGNPVRIICPIFDDSIPRGPLERRGDLRQAPVDLGCELGQLIAIHGGSLLALQVACRLGLLRKVQPLSRLFDMRVARLLANEVSQLPDAAPTLLAAQELVDLAT
eukprot:6502427-Pyramimonas_sp.AAC.1